VHTLGTIAMIGAQADSKTVRDDALRAGIELARAWKAAEAPEGAA
jgi:hypothetical protein